MRKTMFILTGFILLIWGVSFSKETNDPKKWTIDDVLKQESAGSFDVSPDGKWVVWVKTRPDKKQDRTVGDLYITGLTDSTKIQLTRGKYNDRSPQWSPDGKWIAFTSVRGEDKEKKNQIWLINPKGGEPWQVTKMKNGVNSFQWQDAKHLIFTAREDTYLREQELKKKKDNAIVVGDQEHFLPVRLFQTCIKGKKVTRLSDNTGKIGEFAVSPDGRWVVTNEAQSIHFPYDYKIKPRQFLYNLKEKTRTGIFPGKKRSSRFAWNLDSKGFFCSVPFANDPDNDYVSVSTLYFFSLSTMKPEQVPLDWKWELSYGYQVTGEGLLTSLANGPWNKLAFYKKVNGKWQNTPLNDPYEKNIYIQDVSKNGETVVFTYTTAGTPPRVKAGTIRNHQIQNQKKIIQLNLWMEKKYLAKSEIIHWKGARGDRVDGVLFYPYNYEKGKKYPLMSSIHGGPAGVDRDAFREAWSTYPNLLSSRGVFVLKVNYHGSGNYGLKWMESIKGHYYEYEVPDIMKGIDYLINKGLVDPDQLGIMGWSNGAILAIQCVVKSNRFKVVAPGAGDVNWTSDYGNCAFGAGFDNAYFGGPPWDNPQYYIKKSPLFKMRSVTTPTILFFGTEDTNVPTEQGWEHYRALQQIGKTPVRFILFPGEPHGLRKLSHQRRKMEEELAWFDKYFFETYEKPNEAFKKDSPLAAALKIAGAKRSDHVFGETINHILLPEMVKTDDLCVSRFEITRAQYAQYNRFYKFVPGTGNYPVTKISFVKARAYCRWAGKLSGKKFHLPTEKEMRTLQAKAKGNLANENNLDYWAGYSITPDEVDMLQAKLKKLPPEMLLKPVGSFKPVGENGVYDLGGNVAEWCVAKDGSGKILGLSAVTPQDAKSVYHAPDPDFVGFRVIVEK